MIVVAESMPKRMTASQVIFFVAAASADLKGHAPTYSQIKDYIGEGVARSLHSTYRVLLEKCPAYPNGLGLLCQERNPADHREYFLRLTPKGRKLMERLALKLEPED